MNEILGVIFHQIYDEKGGVDGDVPTIVAMVWTIRWQRRVLIEDEHHCCRERQTPPDGIHVSESVHRKARLGHGCFLLGNKFRVNPQSRRRQACTKPHRVLPRARSAFGDPVREEISEVLGETFKGVSRA